MQSRGIQVSLLLKYISPVGHEANANVFPPQLSHQRENEVHWVLKYAIIEDWEAQKLEQLETNFADQYGDIYPHLFSEKYITRMESHGDLGYFCHGI